LRCPDVPDWPDSSMMHSFDGVAPVVVLQLELPDVWASSVAAPAGAAKGWTNHGEAAMFRTARR